MRPSPSAVSRWDHSLVGVVDPAMFWSDFQSIQSVPPGPVKTRGSIEPPWSSWQMIGSARGAERAVRRGADGVPDALHGR